MQISPRVLIYTVLFLATAPLVTPAFAETTKVKPIVGSVVAFESVTTMPANLASNILNAAVYSVGDKRIGEVSDIIFNDQNQMIALKVGAGGFLGVDELYVAVPMSDITFSYVNGMLRISTDLAEQDIRDAIGK